MKSTKRLPRRSSGFTLIELLVVVIIIGILAAIALPNFIGAQDKAREASVKANMRTCQIAAESYATDSAGSYPTGPQDSNYINYFPGGSSTLGGTAGNIPINPFTGAATVLSTGSVSNVVQTRSQAPAALTGAAAGGIAYNSINQNGSANTSYAIEGAGKTGVALGGLAAGTTLVLSNQ